MDSTVQRALDVGVYAPIGFLVSPKTSVNELAAAGRKQIAFSRSLGRSVIRSVARGLQTKDVAPTTEPAVRSRPAAKADAGVISGYDEMTARELIALIRSCSPPQLTWLRSAEQAGKARVTVLRALDQRQSSV